MKIQEKLSLKLQQRISQGILRELKPRPEKIIDFYSNDYLGLLTNESYQAVLRESLEKSNLPSGAGGARLLSGNHPDCIELEKELAQFFRAQSALFFSSGYQANSAFWSCIADRHDCILYDQKSHASMKEGFRLSFAQKASFKHQDLNDLERLLNLHSNKDVLFVAVESLYSMDGDYAPLQEISELCEKYNAALVVDEAHTTGIFGSEGEGYCCELGLENKVFARIHTFGKAFASQGAAIVGSEELHQYLINFAHGFIYTTGPSPFSTKALRVALSYVQHAHNLRSTLKDIIQVYVCESQKRFPNLKHSLSPIQSLPVNGIEKCKELASTLCKKGFEVRAILPPTVSIGEERIRICLHATHSRELIEEFWSILDEIYFIDTH